MHQKEKLIKVLEQLIEDIRSNRLTLFEYSQSIESTGRFFTGFVDMDALHKVTKIVFGNVYESSN